MDFNRWVKPYGGRGDALAISFWKYNKEPDHWCRYEVSLHRYCVPGRIDSYCFYYDYKSHGLVYNSEAGQSLIKSIEQFQKDIDKPQIIDMVMEMDAKYPYYTKTLRELILPEIAPKSKLLRKLKAARKKRLAEYDEKRLKEKQLVTK